jgi:hypothetical protein
MSKLVKFWNGNAYGTNTGKLNLDITVLDDNKLKATLRFNDDNHGLIVYDLDGELGTEITFSGNAIHQPEGIEVGELKITCALNA